AHKLFCLHGASRSWEFAYREELERVAAEAPWFKYLPAVSRPWEDPEWKGETGRVDDLLRKYEEAWGLRPEATTAYLCGHPSMVENSRGILQRAGWKKEAMFDEVYFVQGKSGVTNAAETVSTCFSFPAARSSSFRFKAAEPSRPFQSAPTFRSG